MPYLTLSTQPLRIDLEPEVERRLRDLATLHGLDESGYVRRLIERSLPEIEALQRPLWETLPPEEWKRVTREWVDSHAASIQVHQ